MYKYNIIIMFFSLLGKFFIKNNDNPRAYFYLFVAGMLFYILLHYYLNSRELGGVLSGLNNYLYYIIPVDFLIGAYLCKSGISSEQSDNDEEEEDDDDESGKHKYTEAEKQSILKNMEKAKRAREMEGKGSKVPFMKRERKDDAKEQEQYILQQKMIRERQMMEAMARQKAAEAEQEAIARKAAEIAAQEEEEEEEEVVKAPSKKKLVVKKKTSSESHQQIEDTEIPVYDD